MGSAMSNFIVFETIERAEDGCVMIATDAIAAVEPHYYQASRTAMVQSVGSRITLKGNEGKSILVRENPQRVWQLIESISNTKEEDNG